MSRLLDERLAASKNTNNQQTDKELSVYCEGIMQSKGVVTAASICQDAEKLVSLTESIIAATQTLPVMPTVGKQLMQEASVSLQSKSSYKFLSGLNLACGYGAIVKNTIGVDALLTENLSPQHKTLLLEAFKEFQSLSSAGKSMVVEKFPSLPSMVVSEATHKKMVEASVEVLQEAKVPTKLIQYIIARIKPLKATVNQIKELKTLKAVLTAFDTRLQQMLKGGAVISIKGGNMDAQALIKEITFFYAAMQEFLTEDLAVILEMDAMEPAKAKPDEPIFQVLNGAKEVYNMIMGRLKPEGIIAGIIAKIAGGRAPNLKSVVDRSGAPGGVAGIGTDFINCSYNQLVALSKLGLSSGQDVAKAVEKMSSTSAKTDGGAAAAPAKNQDALMADLQALTKNLDPKQQADMLNALVQKVLAGNRANMPTLTNTPAQPNQPAAAQPSGFSPASQGGGPSAQQPPFPSR